MLKVGYIGLGLMGKSIARNILKAGINFFDTADLYSRGVSEIVLGNTLKSLGTKRESVVVATKVFFPLSEDINDRGLSRKHILDSIDKSLDRLQMDYVDLYQIHRWDSDTPIEETMEALHDVVRSGKTRYIGASSMFAWQFSKAQYTAQNHGWTRFVSMQSQYNLISREDEREMIPLCLDQGIGLTPFGPMALGFFAGNHKREGGKQTLRAKWDEYADARAGNSNMERPDVSQWLQLLGSTEQAVGSMKENPPNPVRYFIDYGKEHVGQIAALWFLFQQE